MIVHRVLGKRWSRLKSFLKLSIDKITNRYYKVKITDLGFSVGFMSQRVADFGSSFFYAHFGYVFSWHGAEKTFDYI